MINTLGWLFMIGSVSGVTLLAGWCYWRVLTLPENHVVKPPDVLGG